MWIYTPTAMVSLVAHRNKPDILLARARLPGDLQRMFPGCKVKRTPSADYRYRAEVTRLEARKAVADAVVSIDYDNVKGAIPKRGAVHALRATMMSSTWSAALRAQQAAARERMPAWGDPGSDLAGL